MNTCKNCKTHVAIEGKRLCIGCNKAAREAARRYYWKNKGKETTALKRYREKLKNEIYEAYGGAFCKCCGNDRRECLQIDHINGGGSAHLKSINNGKNIYTWLRKNKYPEGFQVLCANCNWIKRYLGYCNCMERRKVQ